MPRLSAPRPQTIPVIEPPRWAVPAKGEVRLEVSLMAAAIVNAFLIL
jgi:hypothetical protein